MNDGGQLVSASSHSGIRTADPFWTIFGKSRRARIGMDRPPYASYALVLPPLPPLSLRLVPKSHIRDTGHQPLVC